jgi:hypothetical protein
MEQDGDERLEALLQKIEQDRATAKRVQDQLLSALADAVDVLDAIGRARHRSVRMRVLLPYLQEARDTGLEALKTVRGW